MKVKISVASHQRLAVFLNKKRVKVKAGCTKLPKRKKKKKAGKKKPEAKKKSATKKTTSKKKAAKKKVATKKKKKGPGKAKATLTLERGWHQLLVASFYGKGCVKKWTVQASLSSVKKFEKAKALKISSSPSLDYSFRFLHYRKRLRGSSLSPDGEVVSYWTAQRNNKGKLETWREVRLVRSGKRIFHERPLRKTYKFKWSTSGRYFSFVTYQKGRATLWVVNRKTKKQRRLLQGVKGLSSYEWSPDEKTIVYSWWKKGKKTKMEKAGLKRLRDLTDRWPWSRTRYYLSAVDVRSAVSMRISAGKLSSYQNSFHPTKNKFLLTRYSYNHDRRPFHTEDVYEFDLSTWKAKKLLSGLRFFRGVGYSPNGKKLLFLGGPSMFGKVGTSKNLAKGQVSNEYDTQAYLYDLATKKVTCITLSFNPRINKAYWNRLDGNIYFNVLDRVRYSLMRYNPRTKSFMKMNTQTDSVFRTQFARNKLVAVYVGNDVKHPSRLYSLNLKTNQSKLLYAPSRRWFRKLQIPRVKTFYFTNKKGEKRQGRVYFPLHYDAKKKYPTIVYYYGGTYPSPRYFDGSYPYHWWASQGYFVVILQLSGAIGFGQKYAAYHSSEWGTIVPFEIIAGVKSYLKQFPAAHPKKIGCTGASYGGFTTMNVITKTNLFGAAISHAGISNISSYWGVGYWGYLYNSVSAPNRYPWSHKQFYVDNSPLYHAHKVTTPLLLLHGDKDPNVPPGESFQMFAALKLLKKTVELVLIHGEKHGVRNFKKRVLWQKTMLAWFDYHLKGEKQWWYHLYKHAKKKAAKKKTAKKKASKKTTKK